MPNKTSKYKLNQWVPEDTFLRTDFNADNAALEAALTNLQTAIDAHPQPVFGTYTGSASITSTSKKTITLNFRPKMVIVVRANGLWQNEDACHCALTYDGSTHESGVTITSTGFTVQNYTSLPYRQMNLSSTPYVYMALR